MGAWGGVNIIKVLIKFLEESLEETLSRLDKTVIPKLIEELSKTTSHVRVYRILEDFPYLIGIERTPIFTGSFLEANSKKIFFGQV